MGLIRFAMSRPMTVMVAVISIVLASILAISRMKVDIFPDLNSPVICVVQPYGGMDPSQMEGYLVSYYEYHFLYITGIEHVESKSVQNMGLIKLYFHRGTDMAQALAQTVSYVERARAFMPPGTVAPFVVRFDAGSVPVGQLVFSSDTRTVADIQDLALFRARPILATLPGVSAPPPFGSSQRTVVIRVDPDRLRAYHLSADDVTRAVATGNAILPAGEVRIGDIDYLSPINSVVTGIQELAGLPIRIGSGPTVFLRDLGTVENGADILTGYGLVNGKRTVYIPVTKHAEASTLDVVNRVKAALPRMQAAIPEDIRVSYEFDQSPTVTNAVRNLAIEGFAGALLTGLMVLLFLREPRSAAIVVVTIPFALFGAVLGLWMTGQTLNIMTLGGLALAVGILVDEATVAIENIHAHLAQGAPLERAVLDGIRETAVPRLLSMLAIIAVFVPALFMAGIARSLFVPLALAVGFAVAASYLLSSTLLPVLSAWWLRRHRSHAAPPRWLALAHQGYERVLGRIVAHGWLFPAVYVLSALILIPLLTAYAGLDLFPPSDQGQIQIRLRAPTGTRVERTEVIARKALETIGAEAGAGNVAVTLGFVGMQTPNYPINSIFLWTGGPHEAVLQVALRPGSGIRLEPFKERLRKRLAETLPGTSVSFEAGDIVSQILSFGASTPIEVAVSGPNLAADRAFAEKIMQALRGLAGLRDLTFEQPLDYPTLEVKLDRERAGQLGVTVSQVGRALAAATSSSRYIEPIYWRDPGSGIAYQVQVELPQARVASAEDLLTLPASGADGVGPLIGDVAQLGFGRMLGEFDRYNQQRTIGISANVFGMDLGSAARAVSEAVQRVGQPPRGVNIALRGQLPALAQTVSGLENGLLLALAAIFLLLAAYFQSFAVALVVLLAAPGALLGVLLMLWVTGTTLNIQSYLGAITAAGVSTANAVLLIALAEAARNGGGDAQQAALHAARRRLRPILMTTAAMVAGMLPIALGLGEGGEQAAPLGRAVIGGLLGSTAAVLLVLPAIFARLRGAGGRASLHPDDAASTTA